MKIPPRLLPACLVFVVVMTQACFGSSGGGALPPRSDGGLDDDAGAMEDGGTDAVLGSGTDAAVVMGDAQVPALELPYRVIYWGDYPSSGAFTATVLELPSGQSRSFELSGLSYLDSGGVTRSGDRLVFSDEGSAPEPAVLRAFDTGTGAAVTLAQSDSDAGLSYFHSIAVSQDGKRVAYALKDDTGDRLYAANITGEGAVDEIAMNTPSEGTFHDVSWSPGGRLAMSVEITSSTDFMGIVIGERVGSTWTGKSPAAYAAYGSHMVWDSTDNLYFIARHTLLALHLTRYSAATGTETVLAEADAVLSAVGSCHALQLSPDGRQLAFRAASLATDYDDVYRFDLVTRSVTQLTHLAGETPVGDANSFVWSPDSKWLAFPVRWVVPDGVVGLTGSVFVVDLEGKLRARLDPPETDFQVGAGIGGFSPDSATLYLVADVRSNGDQELYAIDLDHPPVDAWKSPLVGVSAGHDIEGVIVVP